MYITSGSNDTWYATDLASLLFNKFAVCVDNVQCQTGRAMALGNVARVNCKYFYRFHPPMLAYLNSFREWKKSLALPSPGTFEGLHREGKEYGSYWTRILLLPRCSLSNVAFEGGQGDLAKGLSPSFQVSHAFTLRSPMLPPTYHFASILSSGKVTTMD